MTPRMIIIDFNELKSEMEAMMDRKLNEILFADRFSHLPSMLTVPQAAKILGLDQRTVRRMLASNKLTYTRAGKRTTLIPKDEVLKIVKQGKQI